MIWPRFRRDRAAAFRRALSHRRDNEGGSNGALGALRKLEAELLNPLIVDSANLKSSVDNVCKHSFELPLCYAEDSVRVAAARREHRLVQELLSMAQQNMHFPKDVQHSCCPVTVLPVGPILQQRVPFHKLSSTAIASSIYYSATWGGAGFYIWKASHKKNGYLAARDSLLNILYTFELGRKTPSTSVVRAVIGAIQENRWDQRPGFRANLLRLMQDYFNPEKRLRNNFSDDFSIFKSIVARNSSVLLDDGLRAIQYEEMYTWLLASKASRRLSQGNSELQAETCLLEALKVFNDSMSDGFVQRCSFKRNVLLELGKEEGRVEQSMLSLIKFLHDEAATSRLKVKTNILHKTKLTQPGDRQELLLTKYVRVQSHRARIAYKAVLLELARLGRHRELINAIRRLFSGIRSDSGDASLLSNGIMDNSTVVRSEDVISTPFPEGIDEISYSSASETIGPLQKLRMTVAQQSVFRPGLDERSKDWSQQNRDAGDSDWRAKLLADVLRSCDMSSRLNASATPQERLMNVSDLAVRLMAISASEGIVLRDDFRAAWIQALPAFFYKRTEELGENQANGPTTQNEVFRSSAPSHALVLEHAVNSNGDQVSVSDSSSSGQFVFSIDRQEMVDVSALARDAENALLKSANAYDLHNVASKIDFSHAEDKKSNSVESMNMLISHVEDTVFTEFSVSSFSKSCFAGSPVLSDTIGDLARGTLIYTLSEHYGAQYMPEILRRLNTYIDCSYTKEFPYFMWKSLISNTAKYCLSRKADELITQLDQSLGLCDVTRRHPEAFRDIVKLNIKLKYGPSAIKILKIMRRQGVSANLDLYRGVVVALYSFKFKPSEHLQHADLFLRPQELVSWILREARRDAVKIPATFYADLMLIFIKHRRVWELLHNSESEVVKNSKLLSGDSSVETIIDNAKAFVHNCVMHNFSRSETHLTASSRSNKEGKSEQPQEQLFRSHTFQTMAQSLREVDSGTGKNPKRRTLYGEPFTYILPEVYSGIQTQHNLLLRRLLVIMCEAGKYDEAADILLNSTEYLGITPSASCYEVALDYLLCKRDNLTPDFVTAEDMLAKAASKGLIVSSKIIDKFGMAHLLLCDAAESLDVVQELSTQYRVMPSPRFLLELIKFSLKHEDEPEARRAYRVICDLKWNQGALKPKVMQLMKQFSNTTEKNISQKETYSVSQSLIEAMRMLFTGSSVPDQGDLSETRSGSNNSASEVNGAFPVNSSCFEEGWNKRDFLLSRESVKKVFEDHGSILTPRKNSRNHRIR